jgi:hypothetical protein
MVQNGSEEVNRVPRRRVNGTRSVSPSMLSADVLRRSKPVGKPAARSSRTGRAPHRERVSATLGGLLGCGERDVQSSRWWKFPARVADELGLSVEELATKLGAKKLSGGTSAWAGGTNVYREVQGQWPGTKTRAWMFYVAPVDPLTGFRQAMDRPPISQKSCKTFAFALVAADSRALYSALLRRDVKGAVEQGEKLLTSWRRNREVCTMLGLDGVSNKGVARRCRQVRAPGAFGGWRRDLLAILSDISLAGHAHAGGTRLPLRSPHRRSPTARRAALCCL